MQNSAARVVKRVRKFDHITPVLRELHWLPVQQIIKYKVLLNVFKSIQGNAPSYVCDLLVRRHSLRVTRSSTDILLNSKRTKSSFGERIFSAMGPNYWNNLPRFLRAIDDIDTFINSQKCHLFREAFGEIAR